MRRGRNSIQDLTDEELLAQAQKSARIIGEIFDRHHASLLVYFKSRIQSLDVAADLSVETLAAALEGAHRFDPGMGTARQWLYGIARNKLYEYWREAEAVRESTNRLGIHPGVLDEETIRSFERAEASADQGALLAALDRLPDMEREAVYLRVIEELGYAEIAIQLCCSPGAARVRVHRGIEHLRADYEVA